MLSSNCHVEEPENNTKVNALHVNFVFLNLLWKAFLIGLKVV